MKKHLQDAPQLMRDGIVSGEIRQYAMQHSAVTNDSAWQWSLDACLHHTTSARAKSSALGLAGDSLHGMPIFEFMPPADRDRTRTAFYAADGAARPALRMMARYIRPTDGAQIITTLRGEPEFDGQGRCTGFHGEERVMAAIGPNTDGTLPFLGFEAVYAKAPIALCVVNREGVLLAVNDRYALLVGRPLHTLIGTRVADLHPASGAKIVRDFCQIDAGHGIPDHENHIHGRDYLVSVALLPDAFGHIVALSVAHLDITERKRLEASLDKANRQLAELAMHDHLTGAFNRRQFDTAVARETARMARGGTALSLVLLDIDHFKAFNDTHGHPAGDDCLIMVAEALSAALCREGDTLYRYGGEEFAVLLPGTDASGAIQVAERLLDAVRKLDIPHCGSPHGRVTVSAGVADLDGNTVQERPRVGADGRLRASGLVQAADQALYAAKALGRDQARREEPANRDDGDTPGSPSMQNSPNASDMQGMHDAPGAAATSTD